MSDPQKHLIAWLQDAYAMEQKAIEIMSRQVERIDNYPEMEDRLKMHLEETKWQAEKIEECLEKLNADTSLIKTGAGKITGNLTAVATMFTADEIVKDAMASSIFEHMEITCYNILIAAAEHAGESEIAQICRQILSQEESMAQWLDDHIPDTTAIFLSRDHIGMEAKV